MSIKKKVEVDEEEEKRKLEFICKGGAVKGDKKTNTEFTKIIMNVPNFVLEYIEKEIEKKPWMNRTQWIMDAIASKMHENGK